MRIIKGLLTVVVVAQLLVGSNAVEGAFPGSNGKVAFETFRTGDNYEIFTVDPDGSDPVNLTNNPAYDKAPAWNADGTKIAFQSARPVNPLGVLNWNIWVMDADGSNPVQLTTNNFSEQPTWSPDGTQIAFVRQTSGQSDVWTMNADGSNQVNLTNASGADQHPSWSPDGSKIAFQSSRDGDLDVFVMDAADGGNVTNLTNNTGISDRHPDWSPNGTKIAYASGEHIHTMNADGSSSAPLNNDDSAANPAWSPDDSKIVYERQPAASTSGSGDTKQIAVATVAGGAAAALTSGTAPSQQPATSGRSAVDLRIQKSPLGKRVGSPEEVTDTLEDNDVVPVGTVIKYQLRPANLRLPGESATQPATGVVVTDRLPDGLEFVRVTDTDAGWTCGEVVGSVLTCRRAGPFNPGYFGNTPEVERIDYVAMVTHRDAILRNGAQIEGAEEDVNLRNNVHSVKLRSDNSPTCTNVVTKGDPSVSGTAGDDTFCVTLDNAIIQGLGGNDRIFSYGANTQVNAGEGNDDIFCFGLGSVCEGGAGSDSLVGATLPGLLELRGGEGDDVVQSFCLDLPCGQVAGATLNGGPGNDILFGDGRDNAIQGGDGDDQLEGGYGNDSLDGGAEDDHIDGGNGDDVCDAGEGSETADTIVDCESGDPDNARKYVVINGKGAGTELFTPLDDNTFSENLNGPGTLGVIEDPHKGCENGIGHVHGKFSGKNSPRMSKCGWGIVAEASLVTELGTYLDNAVELERKALRGAEERPSPDHVVAIENTADAIVALDQAESEVAKAALDNPALDKVANGVLRDLSRAEAADENAIEEIYEGTPEKPTDWDKVSKELNRALNLKARAVTALEKAGLITTPP